MTHRLVLLIALSGLPILVSMRTDASAPQGNPKPVKEITFHIDGGPPPPASLDDLWNAAAVVLEGIIRAEAPVDESIPGSVPPVAVVFTRYEIQILEVFKAGAGVPKDAGAIYVQRMGGTRDRGTHVEQRIEEGFPPFERGQRYILFLETLPRGRFTVLGGAEGAYLASAVDLKPRGRSEVAQSFAGNAGLLRSALHEKGSAR